MMCCEPSNVGIAATKAAEDHEIEPRIFLSLVWQESRGDILAARYEPGFYRRYVQRKKRSELAGFVPSPIPTLDTEKTFRSTSYGLCQIMGDTARWFYKLEAQYLDVALRDPYLNLDCGASYLAYLNRRSGEDINKALRLYNGSIKYPGIIMSHAKRKNYLPLFDIPL